MGEVLDVVVVVEVELESRERVDVDGCIVDNWLILKFGKDGFVDGPGGSATTSAFLVDTSIAPLTTFLSPRPSSSKFPSHRKLPF